MKPSQTLFSSLWHVSRSVFSYFALRTNEKQAKTNCYFPASDYRAKASVGRVHFLRLLISPLGWLHANVFLFGQYSIEALQLCDKKKTKFNIL